MIGYCTSRLFQNFCGLLLPPPTSRPFLPSEFTLFLTANATLNANAVYCFQHTCFFGVPGRIRTCDPRFRRPMLYPTELRRLKLNLVHQTLQPSCVAIYEPLSPRADPNNQCYLHNDCSSNE